MWKTAPPVSADDTNCWRTNRWAARQLARASNNGETLMLCVHVFPVQGKKPFIGSEARHTTIFLRHPYLTLFL